MASVWGNADEGDDIDTLGRQGVTSKITTWKGSKVVDKRLASRRPGASSSGVDADETSKWEIDPSELHIGDMLGKGAFGTVYRGRLRGKEVAIKKLNEQDIDEDSLESFKKEVAVMSKLRHPNVVLFMGASTVPGNMLLVVELMPKGSLQDLMSKENIPFKKKMKMAKEAALGINWLHCSKPPFIHRDLKTGNLLVDSNYTVKIADFGLTHMKQNIAMGEAAANYGSMGTPLWMAPEVLLNKPYDESVDVYSFGILLWELYTGKEPYQDVACLSDVLSRICEAGERPPISEECPPRLAELMKSCWDADPEKRPKFEDIIPVFDIIILEHCIKDPKGRDLWKKYFLADGKLQDKVSWKTFVKAFTSYFKQKIPMDPDDVRFRCLKLLIAKDDVVSIEVYGNMLEWFGPLTGYDQILTAIVDLLKETWFHGDLGADQAENRIATFQRRKGTFLVRFSSREPGSYAITSISQSGKLKHYRVYHKPGLDYLIGNTECSSLAEIIEKYKEELLLLHPCAGSPFQEIFAPKKDISVGYLVPTLD